MNELSEHVRASGFTRVRSHAHDRFLDEIQTRFYALGYEGEILDVNGHEPDMRVVPPAGSQLAPRFLVDAKTREPSRSNYCIEVRSLHTYWRLTMLGELVVIVFDNWNVNYVTTLCRPGGTSLLGPQVNTKNGSNTDWVLFAPTGTPFDGFFARELP